MLRRFPPWLVTILFTLAFTAAIAVCIPSMGNSLVSADRPGYALLGPAVIFVYLLPSIFACGRNHTNAGPIIVINLFTGWSLIGWVAALAWSLSHQPETPPNAIPAFPVAPLRPTPQPLAAPEIADHKHYYSRADLEALALEHGFTCSDYQKFQFGLNSLAAFTKPA